VTCEHRGYSSEGTEHGEKESTRGIKARVRDLSGGKRRQNRAVHSGQGSPAAQENGRRRNLHKEIARLLVQPGEGCHGDGKTEAHEA
jgi:hypothetical protein